MGFETKPGNGALFKNDRKAEESQPDYRGDINVGGTLYWLSAWVKTDKNNKKYFSLSLQPKERNYEDDIPEPAPIDSDGPPF